MKLVIDGRRLGARRTGVGRYLECLLSAWDEWEFPFPETLVMLRDPSGLIAIPRRADVVGAVRGANWPGLAWERWALGRSLRRGDLLFAPTNLVPANWKGRTVLVLFDLIQERRPADFPRHVRWRFGARYRSAARKADLIVVPSRATANDVEELYGVEPERLRVIYPAPDRVFRILERESPLVVEARRRLGLGDDPFFLFVGKPSRRRNLGAVLEGFGRLHASHPSCRLVVVGPGNDRRGWELQEGVHWAGHVEEDVLVGLLASATALVYPSEYEGFGLPIVEAMACGCPVMTLRCPSLLEAGGEAAVYLDRAQPEALAEAMARIVDRPGERAGIVADGLGHVRRFDRRRFAAEVTRALLDVAA